MLVGAARVEIHVHGSQSLKQKRGVVRSILQRTRNRHRVAIAEVGGQDTWQRATIGVAAVGTDARVLRRVLEDVVSFIEDLHLAEVLASEVELVDLPHEAPYAGPDDEEELFE